MEPTVDFVRAEEIRYVPAGQQVINKDKETLVCDLRIGQKKHYAFLLKPSLVIHIL